MDGMSVNMSVPCKREATGHFLQFTLASVQLTIAAAHGLLAGVLLVARRGALGPVQLVQTEGGGHLVHVLPTVLPHHLTSIIVQFTIRTAGQFAEIFLKSKLFQIFFAPHLILKHLSLQCLVV